MKNKIFTLCLAVMASIGTMVAEVYSGSCGDNVTWSLNTEDSTIIISGTGAMADYGAYDNDGLLTITYDRPWEEHLLLIKHLITTDGVTCIGRRAFVGCSNMESISFGEGINRIKDAAFGSYSLKKVNVNSLEIWCNISFEAYLCNPLECAHHLYVNNVELTDIVIPNSITRIGNYAFHGCYGVTNVTIPNSVTSIGEYAFCNCSLVNVTIPNSVTSIDTYAFCDCENLTNVSIPSSVVHFGKTPFIFCENLSSIVVDNGNAIFDSRDNCNAVIKTATNELVIGCKSTIIPNTVSVIKEGAFWGSGLTSIIIPNSVQNIEDYAFYSCDSLESAIIGDNVIKIGDQAFGYCKNLANVKIGNKVEDIGWRSFGHCESIPSITIPNSVKRIGAAAFGECYNMSSLSIGSGLTSFGILAFCYCTNLTSIYNHATIPQSVTDSVFFKFNKSTCTLYVPDESVVLYKNANEWRDFNPILPINTEGLEGTMADDKRSVKTIRDGQLIIEKNGILYNASGTILKQ